MEEAIWPDFDHSSDRIRVISSQKRADERRINKNMRQHANFAKAANLVGLFVKISLLCRHEDYVDKNGKYAWESRQYSE
jgi:hypothetical protein